MTSLLKSTVIIVLGTVANIDLMLHYLQIYFGIIVIAALLCTLFEQHELM